MGITGKGSLVGCEWWFSQFTLNLKQVIEKSHRLKENIKERGNSVSHFFKKVKQTSYKWLKV